MSRTQRLTVVLFCNLAMIAAMVTVGLTAHSLAVLAAGADYLADTGAVGVALLAIWLARQPPSGARPHRYRGANRIAALVNAGWPLILNIVIAVAAVQRLATGAHRVDGLPVLITSGVAASVMLAAAVVLARDTGDDRARGRGDVAGEALNVKAVLLDTAADAATAAGVAASGAIILAAGGWYWLDPAVALAIAIVVVYHAQKLLRKITATMRPAQAPGTGPAGHRGGADAATPNPP